jgi:hypothetical protein
MRIVQILLTVQQPLHRLLDFKDWCAVEVSAKQTEVSSQTKWHGASKQEDDW